MWSLLVVVVGPWLEMGISLVGFCPVFCVCPLAQCGLDKSFGLSVCSRRVRPCPSMFDLHLLASLAELA